MQGATDEADEAEASIPTENERNSGRMSGVRRKFANMLQYFNPFSTMPPPEDEDEDVPAAKKPRLEEASAGTMSNADDAADADIFVDAVQTTDTVTTASPDDTVGVAPIDAVTGAALLPSAGDLRARAPPQIWTPEEDTKLTRAVKTLGKDWVAVAAVVPNRTNIQCRSRWADTLDPSFNKGTWTSEEDAMLIEAVTEHGKDWVAVAAMVPGRTTKQCRSRWVPFWGPTIVGTINKGFWKSGEDTMLIDAVNKFGENWVRVAALVPGRTNIQCCGRWRKYLGKRTTGCAGKLTREEDGASSARNNWELEEGAKLMDGSPDDTLDVAPIGAVPRVVTSIMEGATRARESPASQRHAQRRPGPPPIGVNPPAPYQPEAEKEFGKASTPRYNKWKPEEDTNLIEAVAEHGNDWVRFAALVPGRTNHQCSERWINYLGPAIVATSSKDSWTPEEDAILIEALTELGDDWVRVAALVPGRTNIQCCGRWHKYLGNRTTACAGVTVAASLGRPLRKPPPPHIWIRARPPHDTWKLEEDGKLIEAVKEHGNNWVRVAALVPGRTNHQCSKRWVSYLGPAILGTSNKGSWKPGEDAKLTEAVKKNGRDWIRVAAMVHGRTNIQCRQRWNRGLCRDIIATSNWTVEENAKLAAAVAQHCYDWVAVAALVPGRSNQQCRSQWVDVVRLAPNIKTTGEWTVEEDAKLTGAVKKHGSNWVAVASLVPDRKDTQCRTRWVAWVPEEDVKLLEAVKAVGKDWVAAAALVPGRSNTQCRQRWVLYLDPVHMADRKGRWTVEEDAKLADAIKELGKDDWPAIVARVPGRTHVQCRKRWVNNLDPDIKRRGWTLEDDGTLSEAVEVIGRDWTAVAALFPGRTNTQCRTRWFKSLDPAINTGEWKVEDDAKLTVAVKELGSDWVRIAALFPGRTNTQCRLRWIKYLDPDRSSIKALGEDPIVRRLNATKGNSISKEDGSTGIHARLTVV
jgi:hypothetical protein